MKVNAESVVLNIDNYNFKNSIILISGNEEGFISKIESIILKNIEVSESVEKIYLDCKNFEGDSLNKLQNNSLFSNFKILQIINLNEKVFSFLKKINLENITIVINGQGIKSSSKFKKFFDSDKSFYSIVCYKISENFKKSVVDNFLSKNKVDLSSDAYWYLLHNSGNKYEFLDNELEKLLNFAHNKKVSLDDVAKLLSDTGGIDFSDLYFGCVIGNKEFIINNSEKTIKSVSDAYTLIQLIKGFSKILTSVSEKKLEMSLPNLVNNYLPKYLFRQKKNFEKLVSNISIDKIILLNGLIQKTELYLRKNDNNHLIIIQRFLLNYSKIIK